MRRFSITSAKFTGQAELVYNQTGLLCMLDLTKADMPADIIIAFKRAAPVTVEQLLKGEGFTADTTIMESGFVVSFKKFYDDYPLKRNRYRAEKIYEKLNGGQQAEAYYSLPHYKRYLSRTGIFAMGADRYLGERHYETEWSKL